MADDIKIDLDIGIDQRKIKQAEQALDRLRIRVAKAESATGQLDAEGRKQLTTLQKQVSGYKEAAAAIDRLSDNTDGATNSLRRLNDEFDDVSKRQALAGDFQSNLGATRGLAGLAGARGASTGLDAIGEIGVLAEELPRLKVAIAGMPATVKSAIDALGGNLRVGLAGGIAVASAAIALFVSQARKSAAAQKELIAAEQDAAEFARTASREEIDARIAEGEAALENARIRQQDTAQQLRDQQALIDARGLGVASIQRFNDAIGTQDIGLDAIKQTLDEQNATVDKLEAAHQLLNEALSGQELKARELTEQFGEVGPAFKAELVKLLEDGLLGSEINPAEFDFARQLALGLAEPAEGQIEIANRLKAALVEDIRLRGEEATAISANNKRFELLLSNRAKTEAKLEEAENNRLAREKEFEAANERIATIREGIAKVEIASANRIKQLNDGLARRTGSITAGRDDAISEAGRKAENARTELTRKAGLDRVKAEQDTAKALQRIQRQFGNSRVDAIQDRDAVALDAAKRQREEALTSEKEQGRDRLQQIDRQFSDQTRAIDRSLREQTRLAIKRADQQLKVAREAVGRGIRLEQEKAQMETNLRRRSILEQNQANTVLAQGYNIASQQAAQFARGLSSLFGSLNASASKSNKASGVRKIGPTRTINKPLTTKDLRSIRARL